MRPETWELSLIQTWTSQNILTISSNQLLPKLDNFSHSVMHKLLFMLLSPAFTLTHYFAGIPQKYINCLPTWYKKTQPEFLQNPESMNTSPPFSPHCTYYLSHNIVLLVFKSLSGIAPSYIADLLIPYIPACDLRSADQLLLLVPKVRHATEGGWAFSVRAPRLWNNLPLGIRQATVHSFPLTNLV